MTRVQSVVSLIIWSLLGSLVRCQELPLAPPAAVGWEKIRNIQMVPPLRAFWNVGAGPRHARSAAEHGFEHVHLLNTFADYPGNQARNIDTYLKRSSKPTNAWDRPAYFAEIVRRNIASVGHRADVGSNVGSIFVHEIEFDFQQDIAQAWKDPETRTASGQATLPAFEDAYLKQWAGWFALPCVWSKQLLPRQPVGLYGPQPFHRDYWGIAGKNAAEIDGTHRLDEALWKHIDPAVDFYIASVYVFYDDPGSVFYIAANIEENFRRTRQYGKKPVYAYSWLRYHPSNAKLDNAELAPWLIDAAAVVPYFFGAEGNVLWGWEPKSHDTELYHGLPLYVASLGRVADLSEKIAIARPADDDPPAHEQWRAKIPLRKRLQVGPTEWIVLTMNPWQAEDASCDLELSCGAQSYRFQLQGRHCDLFHIVDGHVQRLQVDY